MYQLATEVYPSKVEIGLVEQVAEVYLAVQLEHLEYRPAGLQHVALRR